jgi:shikimate kinase
VSERLGVPWYDTDVLVNAGLGERFGDDLGLVTREAPVAFLTAAMEKRRFDWIAELLQESCMRLAASHLNYILAAAGGAFSYASVAKALANNAIVLGLMPSMDPSEAAAVLLERERRRPHFQGVSDAALAQSCRDHVQQVLKLLQAHANDVLIVEDDAPEAVASKVINRCLRQQS